MKNTLKQITAGSFVALLLIVGNVKAEGTEIKASNNETMETTLQLEKWMTDASVWKTNSINIEEFILETEPSMELERWMTNADAWNLNNSFVQEVEADMELEGWMTNDEMWNTDNILSIEPWMTDNNIWE